MNKIFKRSVSIVMAVLMCLSVVALVGCNEEKGDHTITWHIGGTMGKDTEELYGLLQERILELTGVTVNFQTVSRDQYDLMLSSGDEMDIVFAADSWNYWENAGKGAFLELSDELIKKNAPYIWENMQESLSVPITDGVRYGIANNRHAASNRCLVLRGDLMEKYGIDDIQSLADLEEYLTVIKENEPDMIPMDMPGSQGWSFLAMFASDIGWAPVGSLSYGEHVYFRLDDPEYKIFIAAEQPEMLEFTKMMKRWADKGFFSKSVLSNKTPLLYSFYAGRSAVGYSNNPEQNQEIWDELNKDERKAWKPRFVTRYQKQQQMYNLCTSMLAVSSTSKNVEDCLKVINAAYEDQELYNLLNYGIKDRHYKVDEEGYYVALEAFQDRGGLMVGVISDEWELKTKLTYPGWEEINEKLERMRVVNPAVDCPLALEGTREIELALAEVYDKYTNPRYYGAITGTPEEALAAEVAALKKADIDIYVEKLQQKLDEFLEGRKLK